MPWHEQRLRSSWNDTYVVHFVDSLGAQADAERFYETLNSDADMLIPALGKFGGVATVEHLLDERLGPIISRSALLGDDVFFENLCNLLRHVQSQAAVPLLSALLGRWASRFDLASSAVTADSIGLWRGFAPLKDHPRFREVKGWRKILENVLHANMRWFHKQDIMRVLETDAASYLTVENRVMRDKDWVHFYQSEN